MTVKLDNWSFVSNEWEGWRQLRGDPLPEEFQAPVPGSCLHGFVTGHPKIEDGHRAHTSKVLIVGVPDSRRLVTTSTGTLYELGEVNPEYEEWMCQNGWECAGYGWF